MAENKTSSENNPGVAPQKESDEEMLGDRSESDGEASEFIMLTLRKETAVDLLDALITSLGQVPNLKSEEGVFEQAGDTITGSDR